MRVVCMFALLATLASPAMAFQASNGFSVQSTGPQDFVVNFRNARNDTGYWCAAGEFVTDGLGLDRKTRLYRASPQPRGAGQGISFTLDAARAVANSGLSNYSAGNDGSVSAGHAAGSFCNFLDQLPYEVFD